MLERTGVYGSVQIKNFNFDLIPLENDLLSLEVSQTYNDICE